MPLDPQLSVALKEWNVLCRALESGRQMILLRKGGILEAIGGFELEHPQFLLFPTFVHQNLQMLKPEAHGGFEPAAAEPETITLRSAGEVSEIVQLKDRAQMDRLDAEHIWTPPLIDMRFNYRPKNPLYLLLVRVWRLPTPVTIDNTPEYAGCKSWVPLKYAIPTAGAAPVIDDAAYGARSEHIVQQLGGE
jgi:hypothetical protein